MRSLEVNFHRGIKSLNHYVKFSFFLQWKSKRENLKNADYMEGISPKNCANQSQSRTFQSDTEANENVETRICSGNFENFFIFF